MKIELTCYNHQIESTLDTIILRVTHPPNEQKKKKKPYLWSFISERKKDHFDNHWDAKHYGARCHRYSSLAVGTNIPYPSKINAWKPWKGTLLKGNRNIFQTIHFQGSCWERFLAELFLCFFNNTNKGMGMKNMCFGKLKFPGRCSWSGAHLSKKHATKTSRFYPPWNEQLALENTPIRR